MKVSGVDLTTPVEYCLVVIAVRLQQAAGEATLKCPAHGVCAL